ncbi:MAG: FG-GAP-like repeat-containing protein [Pyrinomonadaceae bacterium]
MRSLVYCLAILAVSAAVMFFVSGKVDSGAVAAQSTPETVAADFPANAGTLGAILDGPAPCGTAGVPRNVTFTVAGIAGPPTNVSVAMTMNPVHTFAGDIDVRLIAPNGTSHFIFTFTGNGNESSDIAGPYMFNDAAAGNWWMAGGTVLGGVPIPAGSYRTSDGAGALTMMNPVFAGIPTSNGTWTLEFIDFCPGDIGSVSAATLSLTGGPAGPTPTPALADFDGNGRTDYAVIRNAGGAGGQLTWFILRNPQGSFFSSDWGLGSDTVVPADYDGDGRADLAVWRPGVQSAFYIINSSNSTIRVQDFGLAGDDPSVVGDYNNDGTDDLAVYRSGATPGSQSTWFYLVNNTIVSRDWGLNGDFVAPGDYDGDGAVDFAVQRNNGANSEFYVYLNNLLAPVPITITTFGLANDINVPGDYDGDGRTDLCVVTAEGMFWRWTYRPSGGGADVTAVWGINATDLPAPGNYDGDARADFAVWRFNAQSTFFVLTSQGPIVTQDWGLIDDNPATLTFSH